MLNDFSRIPREMTFYRQWVVWRYEEQLEGKKPTKVLYNPTFEGHASVDKPQTWVSYDEAVAAVAEKPDQWAGIGFVLTENDPYCFIDLDSTDGFPNSDELFERQNNIFMMFESYAEWSPSGQGLHIITKGAVDRGRKRAQIEIYSNLRFMTMTGNVFRDTPIIDEDVKVKAVWHAMGGAAAIHAREANYQPQNEEDDRILHRMFTAENGVKTRDLYDGFWQKHFASWSEADQALINVIVFYTKNKNQIIRIFQSSQLAQRKKAYRVDYLERTISLAFDRDLPPVDTEALLIMLNDMRMKNPAPEGPNAGLNIAEGMAEPGRHATPSDPAVVARSGEPVNPSMPIPPGLVGDIAAFVFAAAHRPVPEAALVAALGLVAGIAGRAYNVSGSGLNQYLLFLAPTGTGKEAINNGISKLIAACVAQGSPKARDFIGPGKIASDAGLIKWLEKHPSIVSIVGEFGLVLKSMTGERVPAHLAGIKTMMLDAYTKSGSGQMMNASAYSDKDKVIHPIASPNFCLIGESTQERFYQAIDEAMVYEGLLPRFTMFSFDGELPTFNKRAGSVVPPLELVQNVAKLISMANAVNQADKGAINVGFNADAETLFDRFNDYCETFQRGAGADEISRGIWSRAWLKAAKLAATVAIGFDVNAPMIDIETAEWATKVIADECTQLMNRFAEGKIGEGQRSDDKAQHETARRIMAKWLLGGPEVCAKYGMSSAMHFQGWVPHSPLIRALAALSAFKKCPNPTMAVNNTIRLLIDNDEIRMLPTQQVIDTLGTQAKCYVISNPSEFFANL